MYAKINCKLILNSDTVFIWYLFSPCELEEYTTELGWTSPNLSLVDLAVVCIS